MFNIDFKKAIFLLAISLVISFSYIYAATSTSDSSRRIMYQNDFNFRRDFIVGSGNVVTKIVLRNEKSINLNLTNIKYYEVKGNARVDYISPLSFEIPDLTQFTNLDKVSILCRGGYLYFNTQNPNDQQKIKSRTRVTINFNIPNSLGLNNNSNKFYVDVICKNKKSLRINDDFIDKQVSIIKPVDILSKIGNIQKTVILDKADSLISFPISKRNLNGAIDVNSIKEDINNIKPTIQPTFTDISYLQLEIISNLFDSLYNLGFSSGSVQNIFNNYTEYEEWINHFGNYNSKSEFEDALSGSITLKDIGIGNDIIYVLLNLVNCYYTNGTCNGSLYKISFSHGYLDKYDFYSIQEILNKLADTSTSDNITSRFKNLYSSVKGINSLIGSITNLNHKQLATKFYNKVITGNVSGLKADEFDIGYGLNTRLENLSILNDNISTSGNKLSLIGVINYYYELNNISIGINKLISFRNAKSSNNLSGFFYKDLINNDIDQLQSLKGDNVGSVEFNSVKFADFLSRYTYQDLDITISGISTYGNFTYYELYDLYQTIIDNIDLNNITTDGIVTTINYSK